MANEKITIISEEIFNLGEYELVKIADENGMVTAVFKNCPFRSRFGKNNNFAESDILKKLTEEILPYIEDAVGAENVLEFETDLFSHDGSSEYGTLKSKISIPTYDCYRNNRELFEKYKPNMYWWLATPNGTISYGDDTWVRCVSVRGGVGNHSIGINTIGIRPFLVFSSDIFASENNT